MRISDIRAAYNNVVSAVGSSINALTGLFWGTVETEEQVAAPSLEGRVARGETGGTVEVLKEALAVWAAKEEEKGVEQRLLAALEQEGANLDLDPQGLQTLTKMFAGEGKATLTALPDGMLEVWAHEPLTPQEVATLQKLDSTVPIRELLLKEESLSNAALKDILQTFTHLQGFGNTAPHLKSASDLDPYLALFEPPQALESREKPLLRALSLPQSMNPDQSMYAQVKPYFSNLYQLFIESDKIEVVNVRGCAALKELQLPVATLVGASRCAALKELQLPMAARVDAQDCVALKELQLPVATWVYADGCAALKELRLPVATEVYARGCAALKELQLPVATEVYARGCAALKELQLPMATWVDAEGCAALKELQLPVATWVDAKGCAALEEIRREDLPCVKRLYFGGFEMSTLPAGIGQLTTLAKLDLAGMQNLTGLPREILDLPRTCTVDITGCGFSEGVLDRLREITSAPEYEGPRISFSVPVAHAEEERSTEEIVRSLYEIVGTTYEELKNLDLESGELNAWLNRLSYMADYKAGGDRQKWLAGNVLKHLKLADADETFRFTFNATIGGAAETCGDRVALSTLHLGVQRRLAKADLSKPKELAELLLRGVLAMDLLETSAREKIRTLPFFDEIEVYLGYPIMLKERLKLPLDVEEMLYPRDSNLKPADLDEAATHVEETLADEKKCHEFLISQEKWVAALTAKFPTEMEQLKDSRDSDSEASDDYEAAQHTYNEGLLRLSRRVLG